MYRPNGIHPVTRALGAALGLLLADTASTARAQTASVFVRAEQDGQGVLRERNGECFVVTPQHVVGESDEIVVVASGRVESDARHDQTFEGDLAALRVLQPRFPCSGAWDEGRDLDDLLADATEAVLESRTAVGGDALRYVRIVGSDAHWIRVRADSSQDAILQTQSGSLLKIHGRPAGMLLQVEAGVGQVLRLDYLSDRIRRFFDPPRSATLVGAREYTIGSLEFRAMVTRQAEVREQPDRLSPAVGSLQVGEVVAVTGKVKERLWYRIEQRDGTVGFVQTSAVKKL